jgi:hypothetical protein
MSELKAPDGLRDFSLHEEPVEEFPLEGLSEEKLLELHSKVESRLGGLALTEVNLVKETLLQIKRAKVLQELATSEKGTPMNQRAQVQNSLAGLLTQLSKIQIELYSSERIKRIQNAVIRVVKMDWSEKPFGRKATSLFFRAFGDPRWVDVSVTPHLLKEAP